MKGRFTKQFYDHATRWLVNEVNLYKLRGSGSRNFLRMGKMFINARRGRLGVRATQHQREQGGDLDGSGRGWSAEERTADAW